MSSFRKAIRKMINDVKYKNKIRKKYAEGLRLYEAGDYKAARDRMDSVWIACMGNNKKLAQAAKSLLDECDLILKRQEEQIRKEDEKKKDAQKAKQIMELYRQGQYAEALGIHTYAGDAVRSLPEISSILPDIQEKVYPLAVQTMEAGEYVKAETLFFNLGSYRDSPEKRKACNDRFRKDTYEKALALADEGSFSSALDLMGMITRYYQKHDPEYDRYLYEIGCRCYKAGKDYETIQCFKKLNKPYKNSDQMLHECRMRWQESQGGWGVHGIIKF